MKKILFILLGFLCAEIAFARSAKYENFLKEGQKFESEKKIVHALKNYFDAIELVGPSESGDARKFYNELLNQIKNGKPGRGRFNIFTSHDGWLSIMEDFESCWNDVCIYDMDVGPLEISSANFATRTVSYNFTTERKFGRYKEIFEAVTSGYKIAYNENWSDMSKDWAENLIFDYKATLTFVGEKNGTLLKCTVPVKNGTWTLKNITEAVMDKIEEDKIHVECVKLVNKDGMEINVPIGIGFEERNTYASEGKVLNIYVWNEELQSRVKEFVPGYDKDNDTLDGVKVNWVVTTAYDNAYQNRLDDVLSQQETARADDKVDLFLVEPDYALKYVDSPYVMAIKDLGITDEDIASQYKYTQDIMTDSNGVLRGLTWLACPGGFVYRRSYMNDIIGTDDPEEVQDALSYWAKFDEIAAAAKEKGYNMVSGYDDDFRVFTDNVKTPWVVNGKIQIDDSIKEWVAQTKKYTDLGYNQKTSLWTAEWTQGMMADGKVVGYFGPAWFIDFCMPHGDGSAAGDWAFCKGPQGFSWGGTWICAATGTDNASLVKKIMTTLTVDADTMTKIAEEAGDFTNNEKVMASFAVANDFRNNFLGGQNPVEFFLKSAKSIDKTNITGYDQGMTEKFQQAMHGYFDGYITEEQAYENFYTSILQVYPSLIR